LHVDFCAVSTNNLGHVSVTEPVGTKSIQMQHHYNV